MSHYPPPDQSYPNAYPVATGPPQSTSPSAIDQLQLSAALNDQAQYGGPIDGASGYSGVEASIAELNSRDNRDNVPANGGLPDQSPQQQAAPGASAPPADGVSPRTNRLRKACDSCSIRKVKVR